MMLSDSRTPDHFYLLYLMTQNVITALIWKEVPFRGFMHKCSDSVHHFLDPLSYVGLPTRAVILNSGCTIRPFQETFIESKIMSMSPRHLYF